MPLIKRILFVLDVEPSSFRMHLHKKRFWHHAINRISNLHFARNSHHHIDNKTFLRISNTKFGESRDFNWFYERLSYLILSKKNLSFSIVLIFFRKTLLLQSYFSFKQKMESVFAFVLMVLKILLWSLINTILIQIPMCCVPISMM